MSMNDTMDDLYCKNKEIVKNDRNSRNKEILSAVKSVCLRHGGMAEVGDGYVVVDTSKFKVSGLT